MDEFDHRHHRRGMPGDPGTGIDESEINYLLKVYNGHFKERLAAKISSGLTPAFARCAMTSLIHRRPSPRLHAGYSPTITVKRPLLSVFGGKLTTYRKLAEHALEKLARTTAGVGPAWTRSAPCCRR
ncbi:hypothetical protein ACNKHQ_19875 [Shigella flexneri]